MNKEAMEKVIAEAIYSSENLTLRETNTISYCTADLPVEYEESVRLARESFPDGRLISSFSPGTFGHHEALDRIYMATESWEGYISEHGFVVSQPEVYRTAKIILALMSELYQMAAAVEPIDPSGVIETVDTLLRSNDLNGEQFAPIRLGLHSIRDQHSTVLAELEQKRAN